MNTSTERRLVVRRDRSHEVEWLSLADAIAWSLQESVACIVTAEETGGYIIENGEYFRVGSHAEFSKHLGWTS